MMDERGRPARPIAGQQLAPLRAVGPDHLVNYAWISPPYQLMRPGRPLSAVDWWRRRRRQRSDRWGAGFTDHWQRNGYATSIWSQRLQRWWPASCHPSFERQAPIVDGAASLAWKAKQAGRSPNAPAGASAGRRTCHVEIQLSPRRNSASARKAEKGLAGPADEHRQRRRRVKRWSPSVETARASTRAPACWAFGLMLRTRRSPREPRYQQAGNASVKSTLQPDCL